MELVIEQVQSAREVEQLAGLAEEIWNEYFTCLISKEQIDYMLDQFQSVPAITEQMNSQAYEYYFMKANGSIVGYVGIKPDENRLLLSKFYIVKAQRGQGFASRAMEVLVRICKDRGLNVIWLTVNKHNHTSIAVYEKKGFRIVRTQTADIGSGFVMDDYIMEKEI